MKIHRPEKLTAGYRFPIVDRANATLSFRARLLTSFFLNRVHFDFICEDEGGGGRAPSIAFVFFVLTVLYVFIVLADTIYLCDIIWINVTGGAVVI